MFCMKRSLAGFWSIRDATASSQPSPMMKKHMNCWGSDMLQSHILRRRSTELGIRRQWRLCSYTLIERYHNIQYAVRTRLQWSTILCLWDSDASYQSWTSCNVNPDYNIVVLKDTAESWYELSLILQIQVSIRYSLHRILCPVTHWIRMAQAHNRTYRDLYHWRLTAFIDVLGVSGIVQTLWHKHFSCWLSARWLGFTSVVFQISFGVIAVSTLRAWDEVITKLRKYLVFIIDYRSEIFTAGNVNKAGFAVRVPSNSFFGQHLIGNDISAASDGQPNRDYHFGENGKYGRHPVLLQIEWSRDLIEEFVVEWIIQFVWASDWNWLHQSHNVHIDRQFFNILWILHWIIWSAVCVCVHIRIWSLNKSSQKFCYWVTA